MANSSGPCRRRLTFPFEPLAFPEFRQTSGGRRVAGGSSSVGANVAVASAPINYVRAPVDNPNSSPSDSRDEEPMKIWRDPTGVGDVFAGVFPRVERFTKIRVPA